MQSNLDISTALTLNSSENISNFSNSELKTKSAPHKIISESIAKRVKSNRFTNKKESEKRKLKAKQTKEEIIDLATEEIKKELGLASIPTDKVKNLLERNQFNIPKAILRLQTNPQYYRKSFS